MDSKTDRIEAEVVLRQYAPGKSESAPAGKSESEIVEQVSKKLRELGFEVLTVSPRTISIAGTRASFKKAFEIAEPYALTDPSLPGDLEEYIEGVYVQVPPTYF